MEFREARGTVDGKEAKLLVRKEDKFPLKAAIVCTSHCQIEIHGIVWTVLWEWQYEGDGNSLQQDNPDSREQYIEDESNNDENLDSDSDGEYIIYHTLPFKVLGVTYSREAQEHLRNAFEKWKDVKDNVEIEVKPEPCNRYDSNAIAVEMRYKGTTGWCKLGYIASELTQYVHPALRNNIITSVSVKHIKFRATYMKVGFYITLLITRKGEWEAAVVKASKAAQ